MTQDKIIELAKEAQLIHEFEGLWGVQLTNDINQSIPALTKFAELILASQSQPTPSQKVDERAMFDRFMTNKGYALNYAGDGQYEFSSMQLNWEIWQARAQLDKPQPTSQGFVLVPIEPTDEMKRAAISADYGGFRNVGAHTNLIVYKAMLNAAPKERE